MGNVLRKKKIAVEELEDLDKEMKLYNTDLCRTFERKRSSLWYVSLLSFFASSILTAYSWIQPQHQEKRILRSIGSCAFGIFLLLILRKVVNFYYDWRLNKKKKTIDDLIARKKSIIENVKENETYKVAKEILEKYGGVAPEVQPLPQAPLKDPKAPEPPVMQKSRQGTPMSPDKPFAPNGRPPITPDQNQALRPIPIKIGPKGRGPIRPFHQEATTVTDKIVDYFFGDGPGNRYALICARCASHNGMARPEEFEYIPFLCFKCDHFNPARKLRPEIQRPEIQRQPMTSGVLEMPQRPSSKSANPYNSPSFNPKVPLLDNSESEEDRKKEDEAAEE